MTEIYGHKIDLPEPDEGIITDVMVLARVVRYEDVSACDDLMIACTPQTGGIVQLGMIKAFTDYDSGEDDT